jgi:hypothetical protein
MEPQQDHAVLIEQAASLWAHRLMLWPSGAAGTHDASCALQAISLALAALSFDFVGTCLDESSEDLGTIQVLPDVRRVVGFVLALAIECTPVAVPLIQDMRRLWQPDPWLVERQPVVT